MTFPDDTDNEIQTEDELRLMKWKLFIVLASPFVLMIFLGFLF